MTRLPGSVSHSRNSDGQRDGRAQQERQPVTGSQTFGDPLTDQGLPGATGHHDLRAVGMGEMGQAGGDRFLLVRTGHPMTAAVIVARHAADRSAPG